MAHEQPAWREDFPIDTAQDEYVERRDFVKFLVLISAAFSAGQFWIATENWFRRREPALEGRRIASLTDVPVGGSLTFSFPGPHDTCVLVRTSETEMVAYSQKCTHLSCAVIPRPDRGVLECPCHEGLFELSSGRVLAGPPPRPLPRITTVVRDGEIYATGIERRTN